MQQLIPVEIGAIWLSLQSAAPSIPLSKSVYFPVNDVVFYHDVLRHVKHQSQLSEFLDKM